MRIYWRSVVGFLTVFVFFRAFHPVMSLVGDIVLGFLGYMGGVGFYDLFREERR